MQSLPPQAIGMPRLTRMICIVNTTGLSFLAHWKHLLWVDLAFSSSPEAKPCRFVLLLGNYG